MPYAEPQWTALITTLWLRAFVCVIVRRFCFAPAVGSDEVAGDRDVGPSTVTSQFSMESLPGWSSRQRLVEPNGRRLLRDLR